MKNLFLQGAALAFILTCSSLQAQECDRTCLENWVDTYLEAMRDDNVSDQLFSREAKFTENGVHLPLGGEGLWYGMNAIGTYKFYVPDIKTQQVAFIGTVREFGDGDNDGDVVAIALRLKIRDNLITEIEQLAIRPSSTNSSSNRFPPTGEGVEAMGTPHQIFREDIPEDERMTREELITVGNYYFTGLDNNDGQGYYPFSDDCIRFENGVDVLNFTGTRTTCKAQFENDLKGVVSRIRDRRFVAVDQQKGIVFAFGFFDHHRINWTWQLAELFKIEDGQIRRIEAIFHRAPFGIGSGWSTYEQSISREIQDIR